jgi:predicted ArsR family transcriptional regulator
MKSLRLLAMPANAPDGWSNRFFHSTRGKIVILLRHGMHTVSELAKALNLTDNAVRAHLATLEGDGFVRRSGERRGFRKPHHSYELTSNAEALFPKRYGPLLDRILRALKNRFGANKVTSVLHAVGREIASSRKLTAEASFNERLEQIAKVFREFGGQARIERSDGRTVIRGTTCPLAEITGSHTEVCQMVQTLISQIAGIPVREKCQRMPVPMCCFELTLPRQKSPRRRAKPAHR